jgi:iron complex outermembrane receptor protein
VDDVNVVIHLTLLLGLFVANASARADERTSDPPPVAVEQQPGPAHAGLIEPVALEPDSTGTGYVAPMQFIYGERVDSQRRLDRQTGVGSVLESGQWSGQGLNAAEVLGQAAGLSVSSTGGLGAAASVRLRGSSSAQVPVYLDGVLLNRPDDSGVNVGALNLESLERIEVYRGTAPLTLGRASMGGAIHLYTGEGRGSVLGSVTARSYGGLIFEGGGSTTAGDWTLGLRGRALRAENDWEFDDDRGTIYNPDDDTRAVRINNDVRGGGGVASARRSLGPGQFMLSATADLSEQGLPGYSIRQSETARGSSMLGQGQARWLADRSAPTRWREATVFARVDRQGFEDPGGDLSGRVRDRIDEVITIGTALSGAFRPVSEAAWRLELSRAAQHSEDKALSDGDFPRRSRWTGAGAVEPAWHFFSDRLVLSPGARFELNLDDEEGGESSTIDAVTLQFGARWSLHPNFFLKGNIGQFERVPSLFELFGDRGSVVGNAELTPESGINRDLGFVFSASGGTGSRVAFSWFVNDAYDLILPVQISPVSVKYQNLARADIEGLELEANSGRVGPFQARLAFTRLWTADRSGRSYAEGHPLPGRPGLVLDTAVFAYLGGWTAGVDFTAMDENFAQTGSRAPIPSRSLIGLSLRRSFGQEWFALARVDNVGNREVFDLYGYPLPGRQFSLSLQKVL